MTRLLVLSDVNQAQRMGGCHERDPSVLFSNNRRENGEDRPMPNGKHLVVAVCTAFLVLVSSARAAEITPQEINVVASAGRSLTNWHGSSRFESARFEMFSKSSWVDRHLTNSVLVTSLTYSRVRQPRSWFGYRDGDPDDSVRAEAFLLGVRKNWRTASPIGYYTEAGTGPMWSNRRVPAATSRLNFGTEVGIGLVIRAARAPLYVGYRFSHISNGGMSKRNPGLQVNTITIGTRAFRFHR